MINHIRTLLLNRPGSEAAPPDFPGEEYVPADFRPVTLTPALASVRDVLFGKSPDRAMYNYRLRQYMKLIHSDRFLHEKALFHDPRVTYLPMEDPTLARPESYALKVTQSSPGSAKRLLISGRPLRLKDEGRLRKSWSIQIISANSALLQLLTPPSSSSQVTFSVEDGLTEAMTLPGTDLSVYADPTAGNRWDVEIFARPSSGLVSVFKQLELLGNSVTKEMLSGTGEPVSSFRGMWQDARDVGPAPKLAAFLMAYAYKLEDLRSTGD